MIHAAFSRPGMGVLLIIQRAQSSESQPKRRYIYVTSKFKQTDVHKKLLNLLWRASMLICILGVDRLGTISCRRQLK
jgi:hypothetical protein